MPWPFCYLTAMSAAGHLNYSLDLSCPVGEPAAGSVVTRVAREAAFDFQSSEYATLFASARATAFQHPLWLDAFYGRLAGDREAEKVVVTGRDASGRLRYVLPLIRRPKSGIMLLEATDLGVSDYACPVVDAGWVVDPGTPAQVAAALPEHDILRLRPVRSETAARWQAFFAARPRRLDFGAHAVELAGWPAPLESGFARTLERKKKRFAREGGTVLRQSGPAAIRAAMAGMRAFRDGRFGGDMIARPAVAAFYAELAEREAFARLYTASLGDTAIGHAFGTVHDGCFHYLLIGCDYAAHGRLSPGLMLYDAMIADWRDAGGTVFDFTIGDEPFKFDFGTRANAMYELTAAGSWRGRLALAALEAKRSLDGMRIGRTGND